ncbi:hypothetical protein HAALTHF_44740n [Vreelandella aquamarina]|nr:hypothetical protein HAALTHF_44740n [Halomonas axialensis]
MTASLYPPALLNELDELQGDLPRQLTPMGASSSAEQALAQADFRWQMNEDEMASDKLAEGIRKFMADQRKLEELLGKLRQS